MDLAVNALLEPIDLRLVLLALLNVFHVLLVPTLQQVPLSAVIAV